MKFLAPLFILFATATSLTIQQVHETEAPDQKIQVKFTEDVETDCDLKKNKYCHAKLCPKNTNSKCYFVPQAELAIWKKNHKTQALNNKGVYVIQLHCRHTGHQGPMDRYDCLITK